MSGRRLDAYRCVNPDCDAITHVTTWPATLDEPADSNYGDGCAECGDELRDEPDADAADLAEDAAIAHAEAMRDQWDAEPPDDWEPQ